MAAMLAAMMIGMRDATGLAPPLFVSEEVHWLSPEREGDLELEITYVDAPEASTDASRTSSADDEPPGRWRALWSRLFGA